VRIFTEGPKVLELLQPIRYVIKIFVRDDSPRQLALGVALGTMIGLIPKGNLIVVGLTVCTLTFRVNLGTTLLMIFSMTALSGWLDPLTHAIGLRILTNPRLGDVLSKFFDTPLVPWTSLNNTVVMGGFVLGCLLFYPILHISEQVFQRYYAHAKYYATAWKRKRVAQTASPEPPPVDNPVPVDWRHA
jgi:uncharacterized protein (TIGR03546 family)